MPCTAVLLPGLDGTGEQFGPLVDALRPDVPTVVVRYPNAPLGYDALQQIAASALPRDGTYIVLGNHSRGQLPYHLRLNLRADFLAASCVHRSCGRRAAFSD